MPLPPSISPLRAGVQTADGGPRHPLFHTLFADFGRGCAIGPCVRHERPRKGLPATIRTSC